MTTAVTPVALTLIEALAQLRSDDLSQRYYAAWYLGTLGDPAAVEPLIQALNDEDDRTALGGYPLRRNAAKALGVLKDHRSVPGLVQALHCSDYYVREEVAYALAEIGDAAAIAALEALLHDPKREQPWEAIIEALGALNAQATEPLIRPFLHHASERVQSAASWVLYRFTHEEALALRLIQTLRHDNVNVRRSVLADVAETGYLGALPAIVDTDAAVSMKLNALRRLFEVAIIGQPEEMITQMAQEVMPWIEQLL